MFSSSKTGPARLWSGTSLDMLILLYQILVNAVQILVVAVKFIGSRCCARSHKRNAKEDYDIEKHGAQQHRVPTMTADPATFSNFGEVKVLNYSLDWVVDFDSRRVNGKVDIQLEALQATSKVVLDGRSLEIESVSLGGESLKYTVESEEVRGQNISIDTPSILQPGQKINVVITYRTAPDARALQFLNKEQTTDKIAPYLFSQCQAIHARSVLPCMDTPSVKSTYDAKVSVPTGLTCLMSAIGGESVENEGRTTFSFKQNVAIPSYLISIVVGSLEKRDISERCAVWCEPSMADAAHWEFESTEKILKVAEQLAGPYVWGRYDMVVLPATFPFGGMENPCLTFITPTLLAGDRSLVNVVAHEISHSWTGNLVTNANWEHFWLNEGFTVFLERKIHGRMNGELERQFEAERGWEEALVPTVNKIFGPDHEFTKLIQNQSGIDPDDAFSSVPYEKGSAFLMYIDQTLGDSDRFEKFLREYIQKHAHSTVTTDVWKADLYEFFSDRKTELDSIDWNTWLNQPGLPPKPKYDSTLMTACRALSDQWLLPTPPSDASPFEKMSSSQKVAVIDCIRATGKFQEAKMPSLTAAYNLSEAKNCELRFSWLMLGLETCWQPAIAPAMSFVMTVGRLKYCKPIYRALFNWPIASAAAVAQFRKNIPNMHPITVTVISKLLPK